MKYSDFGITLENHSDYFSTLREVKGISFSPSASQTGYVTCCGIPCNAPVNYYHCPPPPPPPPPLRGEGWKIARLKCRAITFRVSPAVQGKWWDLTLGSLPQGDFLLLRVGQSAKFWTPVSPLGMGLIAGHWKLKLIIPAFGRAVVHNIQLHVLIFLAFLEHVDLFFFFVLFFFFSGNLCLLIGLGLNDLYVWFRFPYLPYFFILPQTLKWSLERKTTRK